MRSTRAARLPRQPPSRATRQKKVTFFVWTAFLAASAIIGVQHRSRPDNDARQPAADTARRGVQSLPFQSADADQLLPPPFVSDASDGANCNFHQPKEQLDVYSAHQSPNEGAGR
jgi:hypothetical protein